MEDIYWQAKHPLIRPPEKGRVDFWKDLWPVLHAAASMGWTNNSAAQGHGPCGVAHFTADDIFARFDKVTYDGGAKLKGIAFKQRIFSKLRHPLEDDNLQKSAPQASVSFMPLLSGDLGDMPDPGTFPRNLEPDPRQFAHLTSLQYERFKVWAEDDDFTLGHRLPTPKDRLEDVYFYDQPRELTRASLEWTIGDPLYPGIETYWIAKFANTYLFSPNDISTSPSGTDIISKLDPPFRIHSSILPGHLTRGLSLPWQCDFDLCAEHWWPSARPDNVTTRLAFDKAVQDSNSKEDFVAAVTAPVKWDRGLRQSRGMEVEPEDWSGSDDMLKYWTYLGILRKVKEHFVEEDKKKYTVYLEDERLFV